MGTGTFATGKFDLVVVADFVWTDQLKADWQTQLTAGSQALFDATQGQLQLGAIYMGDDGWGRAAAEVILHAQAGRSYATIGGFGRVAQAMHLFDDVRTGDPRTIVHELGHHIFELFDEYTAHSVSDLIDIEVTPPGWANGDYNEVPLVDSTNDSESLAFAGAIIRFGDQLETRIVDEHSPNLLRVYNFFSTNPHQAYGPYVFYQQTDGIGCSESATADYCLMETYQNVPERTEFCAASNHDLDGDTAHTYRYSGLSCWEVISQTMDQRWGDSLTVPDPAIPGPTTAESPVFFDIVKEYRIFLVLDRSGSMANQDKIQGARFGVDYWLNYQLMVEDKLGILWFNHGRDVVLPLTPFDQIDDVSPIVANVNALEPVGATNVRDALADARDAITGEEGKAVEAIVLLTDGIHNSPGGSSLLEVAPSLKELGIPVFAVPVGGPEVVDYEPLETLGHDTGGGVVPVPATIADQGVTLDSAVAIYLAFISQAIHAGALFFWVGEIAEMPKTGTVAAGLTKLLGAGKRPGFQDVMKVVGASSIKELEKLSGKPGSPVTIQRAAVEKGADHATFSLFRPHSDEVWLYLVDPEGKPVAPGVGGAQRATTDAPYDLWVVRKPKPGVWRLVAVRMTPGAATWLNLQAGARNRRLHVHAEADPLVPLGSSVGLRASASYGDALSGLRVTATIRDPEGGVHEVALSDFAPEEPESGHYRASFQPPMPGRYRGEVRIVNRGAGLRAGGVHRLLHGPVVPKEGASISLRADASSFARVVPIYFDVGQRRPPKDTERAAGELSRHQPKWSRKRPLKPSEANTKKAR